VVTSEFVIGASSVLDFGSAPAVDTRRKRPRLEVVKYRYLDHTSDLGMEIFGRDLPELFRNACFAIFDNILELSAVNPSESQRIELHSATREELFLDWLRELLFRFSTEYFVVKQVTSMTLAGNPGSDVRELDTSRGEPVAGPWSLVAEVRGEKFDPQRHQVKIEIKTPTYHMFSIAEDETGYKATVIFDV
jgi:SHS2 domain-containing protein